MNIRLIFLLAVVIHFSLGCTQSNLQKDYNKLLVGKWQLTTMTKGEKTVDAAAQKTVFLFSADRQLLILKGEKTQRTTYFIKDKVLVVNDGIITDIQEKLPIQKLDSQELILAFKIDEQAATMVLKKVL